MIKATRYHTGYTIAGKYFEITLTPRPSQAGALDIDVSVLPAASGFQRPASLTSEIPGEFGPEDITVTDTQLACLARSVCKVPGYRQGFTIELESGMADALESIVPSLQALSRAADALHALMRHSDDVDSYGPHAFTITTALLAYVVLDGDSFSQAFEFAENILGRISSDAVRLAILRIEPEAMKLAAAAASDAALRLTSAV